MNSTIFFIIFTVFLAFALLFLNLLLSPHKPYSEKDSVYECGFSSFRGQNRSEFSISYFIFGLLFLLFDLEILLVYPYTVSSYNNYSYGLFFVIVFLLILTVGFVYELGRNALKISSRQTGYLVDDTSSVSNSGYSTVKVISHKPLPGLQKRSYSTSSKKNPDGSSVDFWRKVNSTDILDKSNPFIIVNNHPKGCPNGEGPHVKLNLILSILSQHIPNFNLTQEEFDIVSNISPLRLELPIKDKNDLVKLVGKYVRNGQRGVSGAYIFNNKINGYSYIGSSISLSNRLITGYLGPSRRDGNRKIDFSPGGVIKDAGLDSFYLDLYILPAGARAGRPPRP